MIRIWTIMKSWKHQVNVEHHPFSLDLKGLQCAFSFYGLLLRQVNAYSAFTS